MFCFGDIQLLLNYMPNIWRSDYWKMHLKVKKLNLDISTYVFRQNSPSGSYHHPLPLRQSRKGRLDLIKGKNFEGVGQVTFN